jgi:hypothetical protein
MASKDCCAHQYHLPDGLQRKLHEHGLELAARRHGLAGQPHHALVLRGPGVDTSWARASQHRCRGLPNSLCPARGPGWQRGSVLCLGGCEPQHPRVTCKTRTLGLKAQSPHRPRTSASGLQPSFSAYLAARWAAHQARQPSTGAGTADKRHATTHRRSKRSGYACTAPLATRLPALHVGELI